MQQVRKIRGTYNHEASFKYEYVKTIPQIPIPDTYDNTIIWDIESINKFASGHSLGYIIEGWFNDWDTYFVVGGASYPASFIRSDYFKLVESPSSGPQVERGSLGGYKKNRSKRSKSKGRKKKRYSRRSVLKLKSFYNNN